MNEKMNEIKSAIARIFAAIINADGILSGMELLCLEREIMPKYGLEMEDFEERNFTFAEAVGLVLSPDGIAYLKGRKKTASCIYDDMLRLAQTDGSVHPKEALICLSFRLALNGEDFLSLVSFRNQELRFSKQEIIYVEDEWNECVNKEISDNYDAIRYMLQSFGFEFVYLPKIRQDFFDYSEEYKLQLIKYYYPERFEAMDEDEIRLQFNAKLQTDIDEKTVTRNFCQLLFESSVDDVFPSILIKIGSTRKRNPNGLVDFIMLRIDDKGVLYSMKEFLKKYDDLCEKNVVLVQRGGKESCEFNTKSFQKTFLEYLYNRVIEINVMVEEKTIVFCYNDFEKVKFPNGLSSALYLAELYCSLTGKGFINATKVDREEDAAIREKMEAQYELFNRIYHELKKDVYDRWNYHIGKYVQVSFDEFYDEFTKNHDKISCMLDRAQYKGLQHLRKYYPHYDKDSKTVRIFPTECKVTICKSKGKIEEISLMSWVEGLK